MIYIHNIEDLLVECFYSNGTLFATHKGNSTYPIISFGYINGEIKITKKSSSLEKLYFSYLIAKYDKDDYDIYKRQCTNILFTSNPNTFYKVNDLK